MVFRQNDWTQKVLGKMGKRSRKEKLDCCLGPSLRLPFINYSSINCCSRWRPPRPSRENAPSFKMAPRRLQTWYGADWMTAGGLPGVSKPSVGQLRGVLHVDHRSGGLDGYSPQTGQGCPAQEEQLSGQEEGRDLPGVEGKFLATRSQGGGARRGLRGVRATDLPVETPKVLGGRNHSDLCGSFSGAPW